MWGLLPVRVRRRRPPGVPIPEVRVRSPRNCVPGATTHATRVQRPKVGPPARHPPAPRLGAGNRVPHPTWMSRQRPLERPSIPTGRPRNIQCSSASTRCQWLNSCSASRNMITVLVARPATSSLDRKVSPEPPTFRMPGQAQLGDDLGGAQLTGQRSERARQPDRIRSRIIHGRRAWRPGSFADLSSAWPSRGVPALHCSL